MNRPLTPAIISKIDQQLLKNSPVTWSTRIHLALYYGLAFAIILTGLAFIVPDDPRNDSSIITWIILLGIISFLAFIFWMIYLLRFNVFKRFGGWATFDMVKTFSLYFLIILLIVSLPFIPPIVQSIRANATYNSNELASDMNNMNIKLCQLERDSMQRRFTRDTFLVRDSVEGVVSRPVSYADTIAISTDNNYYFIDTAALRDKLITADSVRKINDSVYVFFESPKYDFIENYSIAGKSDIRVLGSIDLFKLVLQKSQLIDSVKTEKELAKLLSKYQKYLPVDALLKNYYPHFSNSPDERDYVDRILAKYDLRQINRVLSNIAERKYRWERDTIPGALRTAYYTTLILALLVLIYRHTTRRTFFLSVLTALILTILTGMFMALSYSGENHFLSWMIAYFIVFALLTATISNSRYRTVIAGIGLNLLVFITPFMPIILTAAYYESLQKKYLYSEDVLYEKLTEHEALHYLMAEILGFIILLVLFSSLYRMAYKKWYSLPDQ